MDNLPFFKPSPHMSAFSPCSGRVRKSLPKRWSLYPLFNENSMSTSISGRDGEKGNEVGTPCGNCYFYITIAVVVSFSPLFQTGGPLILVYSSFAKLQ